MHKNWCGNPCAKCKSPCDLDQTIPCGPDCEELGPEGEANSCECEHCDCKNQY